MSSVHVEKSLDDTLALLRSPYTFISERLNKHGAEAIQTRILLQKTICFRGRDAARAFYNTTTFTRRGAVPKRFLKTLFGQGGVQGMDGDDHDRRKALFLDILSRENIGELVEIFEGQWLSSLHSWQQQDEIDLLEALQEILTASVCQWAGVPLEKPGREKATEYLRSLIDSAGAIGPRHWKGRIARKKCEEWIADIICRIRDGKLQLAEDRAAYRIAMDPALGGHSLKTAAVELINILRPTVAVARFITFGALALHHHPDCRQHLGEERFRYWFCQEVRRYYPFFPFVAAIVKEDFYWKGHLFSEGTRVLLDLYGTNHDEVLWDKPERFSPERFETTAIDDYNLIPQGGGEYLENHRCPGEWLAIALLDRASLFLAKRISYDVIDADYSIDFRRVPAEPKSRLRIQNIRKNHTA